MRALIILLSLAYILFPLDFLPDFLPVIGQADDLMAAIMGLAALFTPGGSRKLGGR